MSIPTTIPTHHVFVVDGEGANAFWTKIGAAWQHADGKGFNMTFNAVPLDGRVVVRSVKAAEERTSKGRK